MNPANKTKTYFFFLRNIPKSWDFCRMAQENAALGRLRPYRLRDCRVFGNMLHLPALWVLSNLLTSSICCSCSVTISRAGAWFHIPTPCTCTRASLEGKCRCVCSFPVFEKKTFFFFAEKNNCRVNIPRLLITQYYKYRKKIQIQIITLR